MKVRTTAHICLGTVAALALLSTGTATRADRSADTRPVMALNGWNGQMGPGIGSTKTPFGIAEVGTPVNGSSDSDLYFHTSNGQAAQQVPVAPLGPGRWSSKSPAWNGDRGSSF